MESLDEQHIACIRYFPLRLCHAVRWHVDCWLTLGSIVRYFPMRSWAASIFAAIASLAGIATAEAAAIPITSVTPAQLLADFNVITNQNLTTSNDIIGACAGWRQSQRHRAAQSQRCRPRHDRRDNGDRRLWRSRCVRQCPRRNQRKRDALGHVYRRQQQRHASRYGSGSVLGGYVFPPGSTVANNPTTFQSFIWNPLNSVSSHLGTLAANSTLSGNTFTGVAGPNGAVFDVPLATLNTLGNLTFAGCLAAATPCDAVINVVGAGTLNNPSLVFPAGGHPNIIVNFDNDVTVDVGNFGRRRSSTRWVRCRPSLTSPAMSSPRTLRRQRKPISRSLTAATVFAFAPRASQAARSLRRASRSPPRSPCSAPRSARLS